MNPANQGFKYDTNGINLTEQSEGVRTAAYRDGNGILTNGVGHTGKDVYEGQIVNMVQVNLWLLEDIQTAVDTVKRLVNVILWQGAFDACVDLCFNIGSGNFENSSVLRLLNAGDYKGAHGAFMMWDKVAGKVSTGLVRRRVAEENLFEIGMLERAG